MRETIGANEQKIKNIMHYALLTEPFYVLPCSMVPSLSSQCPDTCMLNAVTLATEFPSPPRIQYEKQMG